MLSRIKSLFKKLNTKYTDERRNEDEMVRQVISSSSDEDRIRKEVDKRMLEITNKQVGTKTKALKQPTEEYVEPEEIEDIKEEVSGDKDKKVYMQPVCLSTEQMFNILNEKFDILVNYLRQVISKQNEIIAKE